MLQTQALDILKMGHNVFLTGAAGSGKTHTLRAYINYLRDNNIDVAITASTGIAATHLGGVTIHSWSGLGIKDNLTEYDLDNLEEKQHLWKRYQDTKVLIIDEISMLHHFRFDLFDILARRFKRSEQPFGGMQVILCGDFFQLPPVSRYGEPEALFAYQSKIWNNMNLKICYLSEQHRQNDDRYTNMLNAIRASDTDEDVLECLRERYKKEIDLDVEPTRLSTHNEDVDGINILELNKIGGEEKKFQMASKGKASIVDTLKKSCLAPEELKLKIGARVMFVKNNLDKSYVNGTLGIVDSFNTDGDPVVRVKNGRLITVLRDTWKIEEDGKVKAEISQYPLRLAWAITIHKSQGMSLDAAEIDLSRAFAPGMGYVALSRVKSLAGLKLTGFNASALQIHPEVLDMDKEFRRRSDDVVGELIEIETKLAGLATLDEIQEEFRKKNSSGPLSTKKNFQNSKNSKYQKKSKNFNSNPGVGADSDIDSDSNYDSSADSDSDSDSNSDSDFKNYLNHSEEDYVENMSHHMRKTVRHSTQQDTKQLLLQKKSIEEIAKERALKAETIIEHIEFLFEEGILDSERIDITYIKNNAFKSAKGNTKLGKIKDAFITSYNSTLNSAATNSGTGQVQGVGEDKSITHDIKLSTFRLAPVKNKLGNSFSYADIRLARLFVFDELLEELGL